MPGGRWRPYLELVRPPALFTASADSLTGLAWGLLAIQRINLTENSPSISLNVMIYAPLSVMIISVCIYAAGMSINDLLDLKEDQRDRPFRPLPSGRITVGSAWRFALGLQITALMISIVCLKYYASLQDFGQKVGLLFPLCVAGTIAATYFYNQVFKTHVIAPLIMGLCRLGNFWIGASLILTLYPELLDQTEKILLTPTLISMGTLAYVASLTALSRFEVSGGSAAIWAAVTLVIMSAHPLLWIALGYLEPLSGLSYLLGLSVSIWIALQLRAILTDPTPKNIQRAVGAGIRGIALTNVVLCVALLAWPFATFIAVMAWTAGKVGRWFYAT